MTIPCAELIAKCLRRLGVEDVFGLVGVPITAVATALQAEGVRFFGHRSETPAGYTAACYGYLRHAERKGPGVLLSTGGPGFVNALAGLSHATVNRMPLVMLAGSAGLNVRGKGAFQELDQVAVCRGIGNQMCKAVLECSRVEDVVPTLQEAFTMAVSGVPGGVYVDLPRDVLEASISATDLERWLTSIQHPYEKRTLALLASANDDTTWTTLRDHVKHAKAPLLIAGEAVAMEGAEHCLTTLCHTLGLPVLPTSMGRGVIEDDDLLCVSASRSRVLKEADVVLVIGTRLNWMLHYGEPPRWNPTATIIALDYAPPFDAAGTQASSTLNIALGIYGDIGLLLQRLSATLDNIELTREGRDWVNSVTTDSKRRRDASRTTTIASISPEFMSFREAMGVLRCHLDTWGAADTAKRRITLVAEGSQTMDVSRTALTVYRPRGRLDAGTWGTMGVGLGYCIAAYASDPSDDHLIVAVEGDSALGFSLSELETLARYNIPALIVVFDNGGIYTGKGTSPEPQPRSGDTLSNRPSPTQLSQATHYEHIMEAVGGLGAVARTAGEFHTCLERLINARRPTLIHLMIDPNESSTGLP